MPWLLPDLLNGALGPSFSEEDKNRLLEVKFPKPIATHTH